MNSSNKNTYCNLNNSEVQKRRAVGLFSLVISLIYIIYVFWFQLPVYFLSLLFVLNFITVLSFLQAKNKFCVYFGMTGKSALTKSKKEASKNREKFKKHSFTMLTKALGISSVITAVTIVALLIILMNLWVL